MLVWAQKLKIYHFLEFDTPKIHQQVPRFLNNFTICGYWVLYTFLRTHAWPQTSEVNILHIITSELSNRWIDFQHTIGAMPNYLLKLSIKILWKRWKRSIMIWFQWWVNIIFLPLWLIISNISKKRVSPTTNNNDFGDETCPYRLV